MELLAERLDMEDYNLKVVGSKIWPREFEDFVEFIEGKYLDFYEMCNVIVKCKSEGLEILIEDRGDNKAFYFVFDGKRYSVVVENIKSEHRYGDGGEFEFKTFLRCGEKNILASRLFQSYETYLDDSMDYGVREVKNIYLLENDLPGREIFARLRCIE